jgi:chromosome segregation ATPase
MTTKLQNVVVKEISLVNRGANNKKFFLTKSADSPQENQPMEKTPEQVALEKAQADLKAAQDKAAELEKAQKDAIEKMVAEKAELEKAQKAAAEKTAELEKALAAEKESKEVTEAISKAAVNYKNLPEKAEELGPMLRMIRKADAAVADKLEALLKKLDELAKSTLDSRGSSNAGDKTDSAWAEIEKRANGLVAAKLAKSFAQGVEKVLLDDKDLYAKHQAEQKTR